MARSGSLVRVDSTNLALETNRPRERHAEHPSAPQTNANASDAGNHVARHELGLPADPIGVATDFLRDRGHEFVGRPVAPRHIRARVAGTAIIADLRFPDATYRVVLKPVDLNEGITSATELATVVRYLATAGHRVSRSLPQILGVDEATQLVVLAYVEGDHLDALMCRRLLSAVAPTDDVHDWLREAALVLGDVQRVCTIDLFPGKPIRAHSSFIEHFERNAVGFAPTFRKAGFERPDALVERLTPGFFCRRGDRVVLLDARPKNVIVGRSGQLTFIDLDCAVASPALSAAAFLVAIDRIGSRYPLDRLQRRLTSWQRTFVEAYCSGVDRTVREDLTFFYPRTLLQMFEQHRRHRPLFTPYLRWYYGGRLERFLGALGRLSPSDIDDAPARLFDSRAGT